MSQFPATDELAIDPWVGHVVGSRYRLVAAIGAGGMGVVYRAWDLATDGYVVVKMPKRELIGDPKFLQRFEQELSALRSLSHPAVVPIVDVGNAQGTPYAVMAYLAGGSLKQRRGVAANGQPAPEPAPHLWRWLPAVAHALDFVHASGYVHRDIKPDNILFDGLGTPFVSDFGVAKTVMQAEDETASHGLTGTGMALGTPAYMAPEMISGAKADARVDQYALAVMTYELLSSRKPFDGPTPAAVILAHVTGNPPTLAALLPGLPPGVSEAVARGMARAPGDRFANCGEFAGAVLAAVPRPAVSEKLQLMCPKCGRLLNVKPDWAGKQGNCPRCKSAMSIGHDLRSLWLRSDRLGTTPANDTLPVSVLNATPSQPMRTAAHPPVVPKPRPAAKTAPSRTIAPTILMAVGAAGAALTLAIIAMTWTASPPKASPARPETRRQPDPEPARQPVEQANIQRGSQSDSNPSLTAKTPPIPVATEPPVAPMEAVASTSPAVAPSALDALPPEAVDPKVDPAPILPPAPAEPAEVPAPPLSRAAIAEAPRERPTPQPRMPVPTDEQIEAAVATIKEAYEDQYKQAKQRGSFENVAGELAAAARESSDPQAAYALYAEASRLFAEDLEVAKALAVSRDASARYEEDSAAAQKQVLGVVAKSPNRVTARCFENTMAAAADRLADGDVEVADAAVSMAMGIARMMAKEQAAAAKPMRGRMTRPADKRLLGVDAEALLKEATLLQKAIVERKRIQEAATAALAALEDRPDDSASHTAVGRYLCFVKESWTEGLPHLAASDLETIAPLAAKQLENTAATDPKTLYELAGKWWDLAEDAPDSLVSVSQRDAIRRFAGRTYARIRSQLEDPLQVRVAEKRQHFDAEPDGLNPLPFAALAGPTAIGNTAASGTTVSSKGATTASTSSTKAFSARGNPDLRRKLLDKLGGNAPSEKAVDGGLKWLASHQLPDGGWSFDLAACPGCEGKCTDSARGSHAKDRCAATGLALLCFYGRGYTHREGPYKQQVKQGTAFLANLATAGGGKCYGESANLYSQGVAGIALAEAYALTKDRQLRGPAQACLNFIMQAQDPKGGGWRYTPRQAGDTSASGWQFAALMAGAIGGLQVEPLVAKRYQFFLDSVQDDGGAAYGYTDPGNGASTSAIGLLGRCSMGWPTNDPRIQSGAGRLARLSSGSDVYHLFYCSQLLLRTQPPGWIEWNTKTRDTLVLAQAKAGHAEGSWYDGVTSGHGAAVGGRLYCTAMATLTLENYYRYVSREDLAE